jgi:hypothetical protein
MYDITGGGNGAIDPTIPVVTSPSTTNITTPLPDITTSLADIIGNVPILPPGATIPAIDFGILNFNGVDLQAILDSFTNTTPIAGDGKLLGENNTTYDQSTIDTSSTIKTITPASTINPIPYIPYVPTPPPPPPPIKVATPQFVQFNEDAVPLELIPDLILENIGGTELLTIARNDTINGQSVAYQPIKNLNIIQEEYNPNNIIKLQQTSERFFANFPIKLNEKIPYIGNGKNGSNVYLDSAGNLIIEFVNLEADEQVEVQVTSNGTIYEVGE